MDAPVAPPDEHLPRRPSPELLARLAEFGVSRGMGGRPSEVDDSGESAAGLESGTDLRSEPQPHHRLSIEVVVPGRWAGNAHGRCYVSTVRRAVADRHGDECLAAALDASTDSLAGLARDRRLTDLDLSRAAFLDTETTGLGGGPGTYAFLIGVGRFDGPTYQVRQFFMDDPSQERAQLAELADWVADCTGLVTFNGRSFDMPLLATRHLMHKLPELLAGVPHLDLLPVARRLWRRRLASCSLGSLETHILGLERHDDVPGAMIPPRYFEYQRDGDARPLAPVFQHNVVDILSMVSLVARSARAYGQPKRLLAHGQDWLSLARAYAAGGDGARAMAACEAALERGLDPREHYEAQVCLAGTAKRGGDWERAVATWREMAGAEPGDGAPRRLYPFEELAKYYEHRAPERAPEQALKLAEQAHSLVMEGSLRPRRGRRRALADLDHRIARLRRKVDAASASPGSIAS